MSDNTILNASTVPGGDKIATDELTLINGAAAETGLKVQRVKVGFGPDGSLTDVSTDAPLPVSLSAAQVATLTPPSSVNIANLPAIQPVSATGELIEAMEAMRYAIQALTRSVGLQTVDAFGRNRVVLDALGGAQTLGTITTVTGVITLTNQAQLGGIAVQDQIPALMHLQADNLRRNITVS